MLTDKEEEGGKEGMDFLLKSNNPIPTGGEQNTSIVFCSGLFVPNVWPLVAGFVLFLTATSNST